MQPSPHNQFENILITPKRNPVAVNLKLLSPGLVPTIFMNKNISFTRRQNSMKRTRRMSAYTLAKQRVGPRTPPHYSNRTWLFRCRISISLLFLPRQMGELFMTKLPRRPVSSSVGSINRQFVPQDSLKPSKTLSCLFPPIPHCNVWNPTQCQPSSCFERLP